MAHTVHRTARIALRPTPGHERRLYGLLRSAGDVWAWVINCNRQLQAWGCPQVVNYQALCRELSGESFGELDMVGARSVLRRYSQGWFEAAKRKGNGEKAGFPRRKRGLVAVRWYNGTFALEEGRVRIPTRRGSPELWVRLSRPPPYPIESVRSVTLLCEGGRLFMDVTAAVEVEPCPGEGVAGVDLGICHPFAVACGDEALVVSGRAIRAEHRLHLEDTKRRRQAAAKRAPKKGERGSRRWRRHRRAQRKAEARHRRRVRQAQHSAARTVIGWCRDRDVGRIVVGDPKGITASVAGGVHNLRLRQWGRTHLLSALKDKAESAGMEVVLVNERGTSSTCPECGERVPKPRGRVFGCNGCGYRGHRDVVGARNIAATGGGKTAAPLRTEHRRAGVVPARRDRRRHLLDARRSCLAPGRPGYTRASLVGRPPRAIPGSSRGAESGLDWAPARTEDGGK